MTKSTKSIDLSGSDPRKFPIVIAGDPPGSIASHGQMTAEEFEEFNQKFGDRHGIGRAYFKPGTVVWNSVEDCHFIFDRDKLIGKIGQTYMGRHDWLYWIVGDRSPTQYIEMSRAVSELYSRRIP